MEHPLLIPKRYLLPLAVFGLVVVLLGAYMRIAHWVFGNLTGSIVIDLGIVFSAISWVIVITDIFRNRSKYSVFWIAGMIFFGSITTIFYLIKRNEKTD
ncbi:hypothetical protein [Chryseobacterium koreense]|uniref:DUF1475 domain-containing protein n=1 Tax=Chryseobacterium koreense CCUG 49689 TaxID=1304281 RepID=A0A0J7J122_9FLAO|nr:hypothetical protein [Chryseobacterium koreense]KMQ71759.1 hypothetical protein ACM44_05965 [Chryseobacterium koreense CCUG 49689]MBB5334239.1 hypothetical protein [Chryseobacterium koreense]